MCRERRGNVLGDNLAISAPTNKVEYFFTCLLAIYIYIYFLFHKMSNCNICHFSTKLFVLILMAGRSPLDNILFVCSLKNLFSQFVTCHFTSSKVSLDEQKFPILIKSSVSIFSFTLSLFICSKPQSERCPHKFSSKSFKA